ncbi:MAG: hypothetical protein AAFR66_21940, partial [Bacteroidota bacterium]
DPNNRMFHTAIACLYVDQKSVDKAVEHGERAYELDSAFFGINTYSWVLVATEHDIEKGIELALKAEELLPSNFVEMSRGYFTRPFPAYTLGLAYLKKGEYEKAVSYLESAKSSFPKRENINTTLLQAKKLLDSAG